VYGQHDLARLQNLRAALARLPGVQGVAMSEQTIGTTLMLSSVSFARAGAPDVRMNRLAISANFFELYGVQPLAGRRFDARRDADDGSPSVMLNEAAARMLGFPSPAAAVGQHIGNGFYEVIGIAPVLRHTSLRDAPLPMIYVLETKHTGVLTLRGQPAHDDVEAVWKRYFPHDVLDMRSAGSVFAEAYAEDRRMAAMLALASVTAFAIATFGIYVLSAYSVQRRAREIALRKLYGASAAAISRLIAMEFASLVLAASVIGIPIAILAAQRYLAQFAEHAPHGLAAIMAADGVAALVAALATWRNLRWATRVAPASVLKD
jgi:hypothetical protein